MKKLLILASAALIPCLGQGAATFADDNASNAAYNDGWQTGDNGGNLFGPWTLSTTNPGNPGQNGFFIGSSGNIDVSGESFGMYANSGQTASAVRGFTLGGPNTSIVLGADQLFLLNMENGNVQAGGTVGFGLQNSSGVNRLEVYFVGGQSNYKVNIAGNEYDTGIGFTANGLPISFEQELGNGFTLKIGTSTFTHGSFQTLTASDISQFRLFNANAGTGGSNDAFFNSFAVVPEPSRALLIGLGATALGLRRRRQV